LSTGSRGYRGNERSVSDRSHIQKVLWLPGTLRECLQDAQSPTSTIANVASAPPAEENPGERHDATYDRRELSDRPSLEIRPL